MATTRKAKPAEAGNNETPKREREGLSRYGADDGRHAPAELNRIRFLHALHCLEAILRYPEMIGAVWEEGAPVYGSPTTFTAKQAIEDFRELDRTEVDVWDLLRTVPPSDKLQEIQVVLSMIDLHQADVPAESAMLDGHEEEAVTYLQNVVRRAYEEAGYRLKQLAAEYGACERGQQSTGANDGSGRETKYDNEVPMNEADLNFYPNSEAIKDAHRIGNEHEMPDLEELTPTQLNKLLRKPNCHIPFMSTHAPEQPRGKVHREDWQGYLKAEVSHFTEHEHQIESEVRRRLS